MGVSFLALSFKSELKLSTCCFLLTCPPFCLFVLPRLSCWSILFQLSPLNFNFFTLNFSFLHCMVSVWDELKCSQSLACCYVCIHITGIILETNNLVERATLFAVVIIILMYMRNYVLLIGWKRQHSHVTRVQSCNTGVNYKQRAHAFEISSVLTCCDVFSCTLLTRDNMISLEIWYNKHL